MNRSQSMPFDQQVQQQQRQQSPMQNGANSPSTATPPPPAEKDVRPAGSPNVTPARQALGSPGPGSPANGTSPGDAWKRRFDGIVDLIAVQPQKTYVASPPELEMILARTSAGGQPK
jgi:CCR4-NOT transcriptional complex subunit CAF120